MKPKVNEEPDPVPDDALLLSVSLPALGRLSAAVERLAGRLAALEAERGAATRREWWTLRAACERKGAAYGTVRNHHALQPAGGAPEAYLLGRRVWRWATVARWLEAVERGPEPGEGRR